MSDLETFVAARGRIMDQLADTGRWVISTINQNNGRPLKVPYASHGRVRLWFRTQSIYVSRGVSHSLSEASSLFSDMRGVDSSTVERALESV